MYSTGENCIFVLKLFNKGTADEYDVHVAVQFDRLFESKAESTADWMWGVLHTGS